MLRIDDQNFDTPTEALTHGIEAVDYATSVGLKLINASLTSGGLMLYGEAVARFGAKGGLVIASAGAVDGANPAETNAVTDANCKAFLFVVAIGGYDKGALLELGGHDEGPRPRRGRHQRYHAGRRQRRQLLRHEPAAPVASALAATILFKWPQLSGKQAGEVILPPHPGRITLIGGRQGHYRVSPDENPRGPGGRRRAEDRGYRLPRRPPTPTAVDSRGAGGRPRRRPAHDP